jgi:predicted RecA/RadA family phage recombinase
LLKKVLVGDSVSVASTSRNKSVLTSVDEVLVGDSVSVASTSRNKSVLTSVDEVLVGDSVSVAFTSRNKSVSTSKLRQNLQLTLHQHLLKLIYCEK